VSRLTIGRPDDWHLHLRDGTMLGAVVQHTAQRFARAIIMPNLQPPVTTTAQALCYRERIVAALPNGSDFNPLMTLYLTDNLPIQEIRRATQSGAVYAAKLYPAGATTNSDAGVTDLEKIYPVLEAMQEHRLPLLVHGEVTNPDVDIFDRENCFIDSVLCGLIERFPELRTVLEHVTTRDAVEFVKSAPEHVGATITAHHLLLNRNHMLVGGIRPHLYCLPVLKRRTHQEALIEAATSGHPRFFLGTDSAPHARSAKHSACGCAGCYTAHGAVELYAEAFDAADALDRLEGFASNHGADFYGLPRNRGSITLERLPQDVPDHYVAGTEVLVPLRAGEQLQWRICTEHPPTEAKRDLQTPLRPDRSRSRGRPHPGRTLPVDYPRKRDSADAEERHRG